ncbi:growth factor receptor-bound protein 14-like [Glandiceps talaboti]
MEGPEKFDQMLDNLNEMVADLQMTFPFHETANNNETGSRGQEGDTNSVTSFTSCFSTVADDQPLLANERVKNPPPVPPKPVGMSRSVSVPVGTKKSHMTRMNSEKSPNVPNPFPELGAITSNNVKNTEEYPLKVYNEDGSMKTIIIQKNFLARDVCSLMVIKNHATDDKNWVLVEQLSDLGLERCLEDHEVVMEVFRPWPENSNNKFVFRKNFLKYQLFENPSQFFPSHMAINKDELEGLADDVEEAKKILFERLFLNTDRIPDIEGHLQGKEAHKRGWKKSFFLLRGSGVYFSTKGTSKEARHLQCFSPFTGVNVYHAINGKKHFGAPSDSVFCLKPVTSSETRDVKCLCADSEESRQCWVTGIRLAKYGSQLLRKNYQTTLRRQAKLQDLHATSSPVLMRASDRDRVAMDFTQHQGRVVENPTEAMAVAIAEGHEWRKHRGGHRPMGSPHMSSSPLLTSPLSTGSPLLPRMKGIEVGVHLTQPWFHSGMCRDEAEQLLTQHGTVDGLYLLRESHRLSGYYVLSLCFGNKIRHYQIIPVEDQSGCVYVSLDDGVTKFMDLVQLVEFYELNPGGLPVKLRQCYTKMM